MYNIPMQWDHRKETFSRAIKWSEFQEWLKQQNKKNKCPCEKKAA